MRNRQATTKKRTVSPRAALERACAILAVRDHTAEELRRKLRQKGLGSGDAAAAVQRCRELGYLDDARTARQMARQLARRGYGPLYIRQALGRKGLDDHLVAQALEEGEDEAQQVERACEALQKKHRRLEREADPFKRRQVAYRYLAGRGFPSSVVRQVVDEL